MLSRIVAYLWLPALCLLIGFAIAWSRHSAQQALTETRAELHATETLREEEHDHAADQITSLDHLATAELVRRPRVLAARTDLVRLQQSALRLEATAAAVPASAACGPDPRLAGVAQLLREGAGLVEESSGHVEQLRDQRDALAGPAGR